MIRNFFLTSQLIHFIEYSKIVTGLKEISKVGAITETESKRNFLAMDLYSYKETIFLGKRPSKASKV